MPASMLMVLAELFLQNSAMADATHSGDLKLGFLFWWQSVAFWGIGTGWRIRDLVRDVIAAKITVGGGYRRREGAGVSGVV